ncbi:hypothetical protein HPB48_013900 [Haemaphysalis longicornis]|uniref:long-chain-fatty-acid--CoA ligase n=1 Tax=Haemaphysalis longicornis TaxID=44386 RepID=A0A9J6G4P3_HAELO|nr:hypothetical protein HPB48_013900 [Haemaphysalis longicornis]
MGQVPGKSIVMINCKTSLEYAISHYCTSHYSLVSCPVTANADMEATIFVLQQVESSVLVCDSVDKVNHFLGKKDVLPALKTIVCVDEVSRELTSACRNKGIELVPFEECLVHSEIHKSAIKTAIFNLAMKQKRKLLKKGILTTDTIWDKFVFKKIREELGGNFRYGLTTSAPAKAEVLEFFRCVFGCNLVEVYGSTEVSVVSSTLPFDLEGDGVGCLFPGVEAKLVDVPEMNYFAKDDRGEICVRSPLTFQGYYKNPEESAKTVLEGGWVLTGDIGMWTKGGALKVIDRKKDIFKLSQVHNLHLHMENDLLASGLVTNTLKLKRNVARQVFADAIANLYEEGRLLST